MDACQRAVDEGWANPGNGTSLAHGLATKVRVIVEIDRKPTVGDHPGSYRFIDDTGLYWGCWYVGKNWCGEKFVASADPRDGLPW